MGQSGFCLPRLGDWGWIRGGSGGNRVYPNRVSESLVGLRRVRIAVWGRTRVEVSTSSVVRFCLRDWNRLWEWASGHALA